jgi:hypothetical protein
MPVSPQDFALYSRMTGAPMPTDAAARMQMAPDVYKFTKDFAKKPNILEKSGNLLKNIAKTTLMGAAGLAAAPGFAEQQPTTADEYRQNEVENSTSENVVEKKVEQGEDIANTNRPVQAKMLSESQDLKPFGSLPSVAGEARNITAPVSMGKSMFRPTQIPTTGALYAATPIVGEGLSKSGNEINIIKGEEEEVVGSGATSDKVQDFLKKMEGTDEGSKLDAALLGAIQDRDKKERLILGANSGDPALGNPPLSDHPDTVGGEDDDKLPGVSNFTGTPRGTVISPSTKLSPSSDELDSILSKALANKTPQERETVKQQMLRNMNAGREGFMAQDGPNKPAFDAKRRILEKTGKETEVMEVSSPNTSDKVNNFLAMVTDMSSIEPSGPRTDIQVGGLTDKKLGLGKSVGISYTPMNGDTKVGFNIMPDPTKPTEVMTYDFTASPEAMESMKDDDKFSKLFNLATRRKQGFSGYET